MTVASSPALRLCVDLNHLGWARAQARGGNPGAAVARAVALARAADAAGADSLWATEDPDGWDAFALLGALARETTRLRLGPGVSNPYHRHPNLLAASVATLDGLSGGRAFLGLGRGQVEWYRQALGVPTGDPVRALDATVHLLRAWWSPPHVASSDEPASPFRVRAWERDVHPVQPAPGPPIYLAAVGPKALALAGRVADGVLFNDFASETYLRGAITAVREAAAAAGRDPASLVFAVRAGVAITDDPESILERRKGQLALVNSLPGMDRLLDEPGFDIPAIVAAVRRHLRTAEVLAAGGGFPALRRTGDLAAAKAAIPTALVARLAVVGPLPDVRARLAALAALGATHVFVAPPIPNDPPEAIGEALGALTAPA